MKHAHLGITITNADTGEVYDLAECRMPVVPFDQQTDRHAINATCVDGDGDDATIIELLHAAAGWVAENGGAR